MDARQNDRLTQHRHISFEVIDRIAAMEMRARELVEGTMAGLQRSPYHGVSSEFAQHRAYVPGDDVRHVDWKVYARSQRYYVRQFQEETNFVVTFLLDCSESMRYGSAGSTKLDHACLLVASLSYLVLSQSDAVALAPYDEGVVGYVPPRTSMSSLSLVASQLETLKAERGTRLGGVVPVLSRMLNRRGIVVVVSDLLDTIDPEGGAGDSTLVRAIQQLRFQRHEVIVLHVLDPQELTFEFKGRIRFEGLENLPAAVAQTTRIRADYVDIVQRFLDTTKAACVGARADYALANTAESVDRLIIRYLTARGKVREARR